MRETAENIEEKALSWVARLDRMGSDAPEPPELRLWLHEDPRHMGAFMRAAAAWQHLERATILAPTEEQPATRSRAIHMRQHRRWFLGAGACAAALTGMVGLQHLVRNNSQLTTGRGEIRRVPLEDGSLLAMNTDTRLRVDIQPNLRNVRIDEGEAWVQVAPDAARPFVVSAGDIRVRAVGTAFSVRRLTVGSEVLVSEGVVEVWSTHNPNEIQRLSAGQSTLIQVDTGIGSAETSLDEVHRKLAWREGDIVLAGESLSDAIAEFNRYNDIQIILADPSIADSEWIGRFRTNEPGAFARAVAVTTGTPVENGPKVIRIGNPHS